MARTRMTALPDGYEQLALPEPPAAGMPCRFHPDGDEAICGDPSVTMYLDPAGGQHPVCRRHDTAQARREAPKRGWRRVELVAVA